VPSSLPACHQIYKEVGLVDPSSTLSREQFTDLLTRIDSSLRALPATAQVRAYACACRLSTSLVMQLIHRHANSVFLTCCTVLYLNCCAVLQVARQQGEYLAAVLRKADGDLAGASQSPVCYLLPVCPCLKLLLLARLH
jgi:hypothetical protein